VGLEPAIPVFWGYGVIWTRAIWCAKKTAENACKAGTNISKFCQEDSFTIWL